MPEAVWREVLDWNGERSTGRAVVVARLLRAFTEREGLDYRPDFFIGRTDGSAEAEGALSENVRDGEDERLGYRVDVAPVTLHLRREADGRFRIIRARAGPFERRVVGRPRSEEG